MPVFIKNNKYDNLINNVVYTSFFIHQLFFLFSVSAFARSAQSIRNVVNSIIILSFAVMSLTIIYYFFRGKFSPKEIMIYAIIAVPLLISLYNYRVVMVISNLFYVAIFKNVDCKKSLKIVLYATVIGFCINILFYIFTPYKGIVGQSYPDGSLRMRNGLGFSYAYITSYYYLTLVLMVILAYDKFNPLTYVILTVLNIVVFRFTDTKAAFTYTMLAIIIHLMFIRFKNQFIYNIFKIGVIVIYPIATLLAIFLPVFYVRGNRIWDILNRIVNGRLSLTQRSFIDCGWTWFGQSAALWKEGVRWADSAIVLMLIQNGLIVLIMSVIFMTFFSYMSVKINHKPLMIVMFVMAIRAIFDLGFMTMQLGPVIIMFYDVYYKYKNKIICDY